MVLNSRQERLQFIMGTGLRHEAVSVSVLRLYGTPEPFESKSGKPIHPEVEVHVLGLIGHNFIVVDTKTDELLGSFPFDRKASEEDEKKVNAEAVAFANSLGRVWSDLGECNVFDPSSHRWWCRWVHQTDLPVSFDLEALTAKFDLLP